MSGTRFIENISGVFLHLERRIYTYILSVAASALLLGYFLSRQYYEWHTFLKNISGVFLHLERRICAYILSVAGFRHEFVLRTAPLL